MGKMAIKSEKDLGCMSAATGKCYCSRSFGNGGLGSKRMLQLAYEQAF